MQCGGWKGLGVANAERVLFPRLWYGENIVIRMLWKPGGRARKGGQAYNSERISPTKSYTQYNDFIHNIDKLSQIGMTWIEMSIICHLKACNSLMILVLFFTESGFESVHPLCFILNILGLNLHIIWIWIFNNITAIYI